MDNNISFKSNIRFVSPKTMLRLNQHGDEIIFWEKNVIKSPEFYSWNIKTCSGGGLISPNKEAAGFHVLDDKIHYKANKNIVNYMFSQIMPERALLVGSKDVAKYGYKYSVKAFNKFKKAIQKRVKYVSVFERHTHEYSQTHYHYSLKNDTWTLCHQYLDKNKKEHYVKSIDELKNCFKTIYIANGDRLYIGRKKITPQKHPELFQEKSTLLNKLKRILHIKNGLEKNPKS